MSRRRWLWLMLSLAGVALFVVGMRDYAVAWAPAGSDPASAVAAGRAAMRAVPVAALGVLLLVAAGVGWWRDRSG